MAEEKKQQKQQNKKQQQKKGLVDNYIVILDNQPVEVHIAYGNTVLKLQGTIKAKAKYDFILEFLDDDGNMQKLIINKAYLIMVKPLSH